MSRGQFCQQGLSIAEMGMPDVTLTQFTVQMQHLCCLTSLHSHKHCCSNITGLPSSVHAAAADAEIDPKSVGNIEVLAFDWTKDEDYMDEAEPKADFVLAADCVYHEELIPHLLRAVQAVIHKKSTGAVRASFCLLAALPCSGAITVCPAVCWSCIEPNKYHKQLQPYLVRVMQQWSAQRAHEGRD